MFRIESVDDLWDHIAYVMAYAPASFPHRDFLSDADQMTLDSAFEQLRHGVAIAYPEVAFETKRADLLALLDRCKTSYLRGDPVAAAHMLNDFQDRIFTAPR